jgi:hypothetical protein
VVPFVPDVVPAVGFLLTGLVGTPILPACKYIYFYRLTGKGASQNILSQRLPCRFLHSKGLARLIEKGLRNSEPFLSSYKKYSGLGVPNTQREYAGLARVSRFGGLTGFLIAKGTGPPVSMSASAIWHSSRMLQLRDSGKSGSPLKISALGVCSARPDPDASFASSGVCPATRRISALETRRCYPPTGRC